MQAFYQYVHVQQRKTDYVQGLQEFYKRTNTCTTTCSYEDISDRQTSELAEKAITKTTPTKKYDNTYKCTSLSHMTNYQMKCIDRNTVL